MVDIVLKVSISELCQLESMTQQIIIEAVDHGIAAPLEGAAANEWVFDTRSVHWLKKAVRLRQDLEIDWIAVAMLIDLLQQKESLEREKQCMQQQLARFLPDSE